MRYGRISLATLAMILFLTAGGFSQEVKDYRLTVYGKVKTFAKADRAKISFRIVGFGKSLQNAFADANGVMDSVVVDLSEIGISRQNLSTSFFRSSENFGSKAFLSSKKDYRVAMSAVVTTDSLDLLKSIVIILNNHRIEAIESIDFELTKFSGQRIEALRKATIKAKEKASVICTELAANCGNIVEFEELKTTPSNEILRRFNPSRSFSPFNASINVLEQGYVAGEFSRGIFAQEYEFDTEVRAVFEIEY